MSFQGDVAGLGLGELLQGLTRGGKDGVLTLYGRGIASAIGVKKGLLYLLESPEEEPDTWRLRCDRAWADFPDPDLAATRRDAIARAERLEVVFGMLEAASLHFRFEPGALPLPRAQRTRRGAPVVANLGGRGEDSLWGQGMPVEYLLLEHARISDESSAGGARPEREDVPRPMDAGSKPKELQAFLSQCDGQSSIGEIADRLGWPLRQCRGAINELVHQGALRLAPPRELLALAQRELDAGRPERAAARLAGWLVRSQPGAPGPGDAELLVGEWESGRLGRALLAMSPPAARALVRRLDLVHPIREHAIARWDLLAEHHKNASATKLRAAAQRALWNEDDGPTPALELLRLARLFQGAGYRSRAATALRIASNRPPAQLTTRIELGSRLIEAGLEDEGAGLLLQVARSLLQQREHTRAISVIHTLLKVVPRHREAEGLLLQSRAEIYRGRRRRWKLLIGLGLIVVIGVSGLVQNNEQKEHERRLAAVTDLLGRPAEGLARLDNLFGADTSPRVLALRSALQQRLLDDDMTLRDQWLDRYQQLLREVQDGDAATALRKTLELAPAPVLTTQPSQEWPNVDELFIGIAKRLESDAARANPGLDDPPQAYHTEDRLVALVGELVTQIQAAATDPTRDAFAFRLRTLQQGLLARREQRTRSIEQRYAREMEERQDWMLATARAHADSQQLDLALRAYNDLAALEGAADLIPLIQGEIDALRLRQASFQRATDLATAGRHTEAFAEIEAVGVDPRRLALPWRVDTSPSGAIVRLGDGTVRKTPFVVYSSLDSALELTFELKGCETRRIVVEQPGDLMLSMHRSPERHWKTQHVVQAAPVPVGEDHVVADRAGNLARIRPNGALVWHRELGTLGGIARTPQFLPSRPGVLLVLSEDGESWLVGAAEGWVHGSYRVNSPPRDGPLAVRGGLGVIYSDSTVAIWEQSAEPRLSLSSLLVPQDSQLSGPASADRDPKLAILRRGSGSQPELASPWSTWRAEVLLDEVVVRRVGSEQTFHVRRAGDWSYVAWEAPNALIPEGRLWVADGEGLRSYLPPTPLPSTPLPATPLRR